MLFNPSVATGKMRDPGKLVPGARKLARWLDQLGKGSRAWLAKRFDVTPGLISQWCLGYSIPAPELQHALEVLNAQHREDNRTTIVLQVEDWWTDEQRARYARIVDSPLDFDSQN